MGNGSGDSILYEYVPQPLMSALPDAAMTFCWSVGNSLVERGLIKSPT